MSYANGACLTCDHSQWYWDGGSYNPPQVPNYYWDTYLEALEIAGGCCYNFSYIYASGLRYWYYQWGCSY
jgi:hypothetical protein